MKAILHTCIFLILLSSSRSQAEVPQFLFGPEFTFGVQYDAEGNPQDIKVDDTYELMLNRMEAHLVEGQPEGQKFNLKYQKFTSPNHWWVMVTQDPGVIEVQSKPMTVEEFKKVKDDMQDAVFASASNINLFPSMFTGGGHINVGYLQFMDNFLLLRNFIVDFLNHNELSMGVWSYDRKNAHHMEFSGLKNEVARAFDPTRDVSLSELCAIFSFRNLAITLRRLCDVRDYDLKRIEIRAVRPQQSMDVWVRQIELIQMRLEYLSTIDYPLPYVPRVPFLNEEQVDQPYYNPLVDPQLALQSFYEYVTESGLKWQDHTDYLWPKWITDGEVTKFEQSAWFKERERIRQNGGSAHGKNLPCVQSLS